MSEMKLLSIREPYASLIAKGYKLYETRGRRTNYRGKVLIHASRISMECDFGLKYFAQPYACGKAIAVADLVDCIDMTKEWIATVDGREKRVGFYEEGRYAWVLENVRPIKHFEMRGMPWLATVKDDVINKIVIN